MIILEQVGVPHCVIKDAGNRDEERKELESEFRANIGHVLHHHAGQLRMTIARHASGHICLHYAFGGIPEDFHFLHSKQFRYWRFADGTEASVPSRPSWKSVLVRQIHFTPVGNIDLYAGQGAGGADYQVDEPPILPMLVPIAQGRVFRVALPRRIAIKSTQARWRHVAEVLAADESAAVCVKVERYELKSHEVGYIAKCLGSNSEASTGRLVARHLAVDSYSALMTSRIGFKLIVKFTGHAVNPLVQAFLRDTDPECFCTDNHHFQSPEVGRLDREQPPLAKWLRLQESLYSLDDAASLLMPLYSFGDSLSRAKHFRPFPFTLPATAARLETPDSVSVTIGKLATEDSVVLRDEELLRSIFITGSSGSGKSETVFAILRSLVISSRNIPILIIDPVGYEYGDRLKRLISDPSRRFDAVELVGDGIRRFNPFVVPDDVSVYNYARFLGTIFEMLAPSATALGKALVNFQVVTVYAEAIYPKTRPTVLNDLARKYERLAAEAATCSTEEEKQLLKVECEKADQEYIRINNDFIRGELAEHLNVMTGRQLRESNCIPSFGAFLERLRAPRMGSSSQGNRALETRDWLSQLGETLAMSALARLFRPQDNTHGCLHFFARNTLLELRHVVNETERNALFAFFVGLNHLRLSSTNPTRELKHFSVFEELHRIAPRETGGISAEGASSSAHETGKLVAQMLAEQRKFGLSVCLVDQSVSKIIPDVLINCGTKIIRQCTYGPDKEALQDSLSLSDRETESISHFGIGDGLIITPELSQPAYAAFDRIGE